MERILTENKQHFLSEFNDVIDNDLNSRQWSESVAKKVKSRRRNRLIGKVVVALASIGIISGGIGLSIHKDDNSAYSQFYAFISESTEHDYDILDLQE